MTQFRPVQEPQLPAQAALEGEGGALSRGWLAAPPGTAWARAASGAAQAQQGAEDASAAQFGATSAADRAASAEAGSRSGFGGAGAEGGEGTQGQAGASSAGDQQDAGTAGGEAQGKGSWWSRGREQLPERGQLVERVRSALGTIQREVAAAVLPMPSGESALRARPEGVRPAPPSGASALSIVQPPPESAWQRQWRSIQAKLGSHPIFKGVAGLGSRGKEVAGDLQDRWENSDSPLVHRLQDMSDSVFAETERAKCLRTIVARDPAFDMAAFLRTLRQDVPTVIRGYLRGDAKVLEEHCTPETVTRLMALVKVQHDEGIFSDDTLLDTSEVELVDLKFLEADPVVVVKFNCQQLNCGRDRYGNVVEGAPDDVQRVFYFWALAQVGESFLGEDGKTYPPLWKLCEMMVGGMHKLL